MLAPPDAPGKPPKTTSLGWSSLDLFTAQRALNAGFWKLGLNRPPINVTAPPTQRVAVPPLALYLRLTLTADMERNKVSLGLGFGSGFGLAWEGPNPIPNPNPNPNSDPNPNPNPNPTPNPDPTRSTTRSIG